MQNNHITLSIETARVGLDALSLAETNLVELVKSVERCKPEQAELKDYLKELIFEEVLRSTERNFEGLNCIIEQLSELEQGLRE